MEVRIGVTQSPKELQLKMAADADQAKLRSAVEKAIGDGGMLWLTDAKGRDHGVPAEKIAYVEIGADGEARMGFGSG